MGDRRTARFSGGDNSRWTGNRVSQCPLCFELFSGESTFAFHRVADRTPPGSPGARWLGECRDPASKGMTLGRNGVWEWCPRTLEGPPGHSRVQSGAEAFAACSGAACDAPGGTSE
jgi:hypothetical protein